MLSKLPKAAFQLSFFSYSNFQLRRFFFFYFFNLYNANTLASDTNLAPVLEELSQQLKVVKVDVDENPQLAVAFQVASIPTVIAFRDGKAVKKSVGVVPKESLLALLQ